MALNGTDWGYFIVSYEKKPYVYLETANAG